METKAIIFLVVGILFGVIITSFFLNEMDNEGAFEENEETESRYAASIADSLEILADKKRMSANYFMLDYDKNNFVPGPFFLEMPVWSKDEILCRVTITSYDQRGDVATITVSENADTETKRNEQYFTSWTEPRMANAKMKFNTEYHLLKVNSTTTLKSLMINYICE